MRRIGVALALIAIGCSVVALSSRVDTSQFVQRSELGMGRAALAESANAVVRAQLRHVGYTTTRILIVRETVDGDHGTVVINVRYGPSANAAQQETELTLIFHRSLWSLSEQTVKELPAS